MSSPGSYPPPFGVGYEGRSIDDFIAGLTAAGVDVLVDVRLTPISRKRGFSKTALMNAVESAGMKYLHRPGLGNPKDNRQGFWGTSDELERARSVYASMISASTRGQDALAEIYDLSMRSSVALMCFEADDEHCHRYVVLSELDKLAVTESVAV